MKTSTLLKKVQKRLSDPNKWVQGKPAVDKDKKPVPTTSPKAVAWCINGAIIREGGGSGQGLHYLNQAFDEITWNNKSIFENPYPRSINTLNDSSIKDHRTLQKVLNRAVELAEEDA